MTDNDLDACRAAFPAMEWGWYFERNGAARGKATDSGCVIDVRRYYDVFQVSLRREDTPIEEAAESELSDALLMLRQKMTGLRDDLTAALGEP